MHVDISLTSMQVTDFSLKLGTFLCAGTFNMYALTNVLFFHIAVLVFILRYRLVEIHIYNL